MKVDHLLLNWLRVERRDAAVVRVGLGGALGDGAVPLGEFGLQSLLEVVTEADGGAVRWAHDLLFRLLLLFARR